MFNALDIPAYYYLIAVAIGVVIGLWKKDWRTGFLFAYSFFLLAETVLIRSPGTLRYEMIPFWSWREVFRKWPMTATGKMYLRQIILNIAMFIPIGMILSRKSGWKGILIAAGISAMIEITQLVSHRGLFEFDDIIHNTLGAAAGYGLKALIRKAK